MEPFDPQRRVVDISLLILTSHKSQGFWIFLFKFFIGERVKFSWILTNVSLFLSFDLLGPWEIDYSLKVFLLVSSSTLFICRIG